MSLDKPVFAPGNWLIFLNFFPPFFAFLTFFFGVWWCLEVFVQVTINGKSREIADGSTVEQLLGELSLTGPLAVELNRKVCPRRQHGKTALQPGDVVEIVTIVGGG